MSSEAKYCALISQEVCATSTREPITTDLSTLSGKEPKEKYVRDYVRLFPFVSVPVSHWYTYLCIHNTTCSPTSELAILLEIW